MDERCSTQSTDGPTEGQSHAPVPSPLCDHVAPDGQRAAAHAAELRPPGAGGGGALEAGEAGADAQAAARRAREREGAQEAAQSSAGQSWRRQETTNRAPGPGVEIAHQGDHVRR